jgi:hypothetical protein
LSGVISFSGGEDWFVNGWGWRTLMDQALRDAEGRPEADEFETGLASHGLPFAMVDPGRRAGVATALLRSVRTLLARYAEQAGDYERGYAESLHDLAVLLEREAGLTDS